MTEDPIARALEGLEPPAPRREFVEGLWESVVSEGDELVGGTRDVTSESLLEGDDPPPPLVRTDPRRRLHGGRTPWLVAAAAALVVVAALASSVLLRDEHAADVDVGSRPLPTRSEFVAGANAICSDGAASLRSLYEADPPLDLTAVLAGEARVVEQTYARFAALGIPPGDEAELEPVLRDLATAERLFRTGGASYFATRRALLALQAYGADCDPNLLPYPVTTQP
jgi:hypothetical protein